MSGALEVPVSAAPPRGGARPLRVLFVNSGIMGHASAAGLIARALADDPGVEAVHENLAAALTTGERVTRRLLALGPPPGTRGGALSLARYRHELDAGVRAARRIARRERQGGPFDVIHFHPQATAWASLHRMRHTPSIVSMDGTQEQLALNLDDRLLRQDYRAGARRDRRVFQRAAAVVATSRWAADDVLRQLPELAPRVRVLPYPVALEGFDPGWIEERRARDPAAPVRVLFVGGSFRLKGGDQLLEVWRSEGLADAATLTLVSDSPEVDEASLPPGVTLRRGVRAYSPEWLELWRWADLFVLPTRMDAFGMVLQEAAAAGLPVLANRFNATPELVVEGETGVLVTPGDSAELGSALRRLIASAGVRQRLGSAGRRRIEQRASLRGYGEALGALIREVAGRG